jgi:60 kDa SS-A/Ro ribonucleoprotein
MKVDKFVTITDNDINTGRQPTAALKDYRQSTGLASRSIVIATTLSSFSIADPKDPFQLDIAGFDSAAPALIASL